MTDDKLSAAVDALMAHDAGATDSGVRDEALRAAVLDRLRGMDADEFRLWSARFARDTYLADGRVAAGYGLADVRAFLDWLAGCGVDV